MWDASRLRLDEREAGAAPPCVRVLKLFAPKFNPASVRCLTFFLLSTPASHAASPPQVHAFTAVEDGNAQLVRPSRAPLSFLCARPNPMRPFQAFVAGLASGHVYVIRAELGAPSLAAAVACAHR